jgi:hypothetical protein
MIPGSAESHSPAYRIGVGSHVVVFPYFLQAKPSSEDFPSALEVLCRQKIGEVLQAVLEAEVEGFLGVEVTTKRSHPREKRLPRARFATDQQWEPSAAHLRDNSDRFSGHDGLLGKGFTEQAKPANL